MVDFLSRVLSVLVGMAYFFALMEEGNRCRKLKTTAPEHYTGLGWFGDFLNLHSLPSVMTNIFLYIWTLPNKKVSYQKKKKMNSIQQGKHLCQNNVKLNKQCLMRSVITCSLVMLGHAVWRLVFLSAIINLSACFAS